MGIGLKMLNPRNMRTMINIAKISDNLSRHIKKRCAYCDMDMGHGDDYSVVEFVAHLEQQHAEHIDPKDLEVYKKMIKKVTR